MGKGLTETEILNRIRNASKCIPRKEAFEDLIDCDEEDMPDDASDELRYAIADNARTIIEDEAAESCMRMAIRIASPTEEAIVYQDAADGEIYASPLTEVPYSSEVKEELVARNAAFSGNGVAGQKGDDDYRSFVEFVEGPAATDTTFISRTALQQERAERLEEEGGVR